MSLQLLFYPLLVFCFIAMGALFERLVLFGIRAQGVISNNIGVLGILGLCFLGIVSVVLNFFLPLSSPIVNLVFLSFTASGFWILIKERSRFSRRQLGIALLFLLIFAPLVTVLKAGSDGGLYHIPHQLWLREDRIVFGLANLHGRFGFSSILEYVHANLWIGDNFQAIACAFAGFLVFFLVFFMDSELGASRVASLLSLGVIANLAIYSDYFHMAFTYVDVPAGLVFVISFIYGVFLLFCEGPVSRKQFALLSLLIAFAVFIKLSSALLGLWFIFICGYLFFKKRSSFKEIAVGSSLAALLTAIWLTNNLIVSGCLFYPEISTCFDVSWVAKANAIDMTQWITAWARHPKSGLYSLTDGAWLTNWWLVNNEQFLKSILGGGIGVLAVYLIANSRLRYRPQILSDIRYVAIAGFVLISLFFWFLKAPTPRFGVGIFAVAAPALLMAFLGEELDDSRNRNRLVLPVLCVVLALKLSLEPVAINLAYDEYGERTTPDIVQDPVWGVRALNGECWTVPQCTPYDRPPMTQLFGYNAFISQ